MTTDATVRRANVLGGIRARLAGQGTAANERALAVEKRVATRLRNLIPERASSLQGAGLKALLAAQLRAANATVIEATAPDEVPAAIAGYLRGQNLPLKLRAGNDPWLRALDWSREPALTIDSGRAKPEDDVGMTLATAGVAETGTLVLSSGADNPVTVTFLPETSVIVLRASVLVAAYEDAIDIVRSKLGNGVMPRTLNLVSGPSRTADVGGRLVTGAHGPRRLLVVVVDD